jgi:protein-L-isoaspartate O-methyltransferase
MFYESLGYTVVEAKSLDVGEGQRLDWASGEAAMKAARISGTENYEVEAPELLKRYESISFADAHAPVLHLIPPAPCRTLDIGAGTGRDAAGLAALGHSVIAIEPTEEL